MLRKSKTLILCCLICFSFSLVSLNVYAMDTHTVSMGQPSVTDYSGYIEMLFQNNSTGNEVVYVYFWNTTPSSWDSFPSVEISYSGSMLTFSPFGVSTLNLLYTASDGVNSPVVVHNGEVSDAVHQNFSGYTLKAYHVYGNYSSLSISLGSYYGGNDFSVQYGEDLTYQTVSNIYNQVLKLNSDLNGQLDELQVLLSDYIYTHLYSLDFNVNEVLKLLEKYAPLTNDLLEDIKAEQIESNTWLEKIFNWLEDSPEQEKEAASTQANQSTSDAQASIEDKSAGFVDSVNGLASSMSYSGTQCAWTFPELYLPEIPGVMSRTQLTSEIPIDFSYWVNQIPSDILLLVRSVLTIALIGYCFKEFYSVIEYVLTMRGGGNSE